uniref:Putative ovule protein n=1 Tax=Solanum chacoense TaxID=4108 RepID=A0A0V0GST1_SOLCH
MADLIMLSPVALGCKCTVKLCALIVLIPSASTSFFSVLLPQLPFVFLCLHQLHLFFSSCSTYFFIFPSSFLTSFCFPLSFL